MLVTCGWWPPGVPFDVEDLETVFQILKEQSDKGRRRK